MKIGYAIFEDSPSWLLYFLKAGFRHVSVLLPVGDVYVHIDPRSKGILYDVVPTLDTKDMYTRAESNSVHVVPVPIQELNKRHSWSVLTCVAVVKRSIGLHKWWIITPRQLYNHLRRMENIRVFNQEKVNQ